MGETCRLCRKGSEVFLEPMFDYREGYQIAEIVMKICPIQIISNDELPKMICEECLEISMSAFQLQKTSVESENWYRSQFGNLENIVVKREKLETFIGVKTENVCEEDQFRFDENGENGIDYSDDSFNEPQIEPVATRSKSFFNPYELSNSKVAKTEKWYQCNFCYTKLKPRSNMMRHMRVI
jgi:Zinc-finger associated domain (zf-AD)